MNDLERIHATVAAVSELEGQDEGLVIEMSQAMLSDLIAGELGEIADYIAHYCDVLDSPDEAREIAAGVS
jgi:hypothetical protein